MPQRGIVLWGARTTSDDPEWRYVSVRRLMAFIERSIDDATRWVAFEANAPPLWAELRRHITDFLSNQWRAGALAGRTQTEAFFVRCDATTMDADDLAAGRMVCLVGCALARAAEFTTVRIVLKAASAG
jgi:phage tail sheath protein FI